MAKVRHVKANKDYPKQGIAKGDMYYTWALFKRPVQRSKTPPRRSQLTGSEFLGQVYDFADVSLPEANDPDDFKAIASELENLSSEQQSKLDNMPDGLRDGPTGQQLEARVSACDEWASAINDAADEFETAVTDIEAEEGLTDEQRAEKINEARDACLEVCNSAEPGWE